MADIVIRGMEMPKNCLECVFYRRTDHVYDYCCISSATPKGYVPNDCPLVPIPPHGRLIDLDGTALAQYYDEEHEEWSMKTVTVEDILWEVCENMPPIVIPADKDGET